MKASREGLWKRCGICNRWIQTIDTGWRPKDGYVLGPFPEPMPETFQAQMDDLRRQVRELGWDIAEASGIPRLVAWLDMMIFRWRLMRNIRRHHRRKENQ